MISNDLFSVDETKEVTIAQVAESLAQAFGFKGKIVFDTTAADGQHKKTASNAKLRNLLPNFKFTPFDHAIRESVNWYRENYDQARNWRFSWAFPGILKCTLYE